MLKKGQITRATVKYLKDKFVCGIIRWSILYVHYLKKPILSYGCILQNMYCNFIKTSIFNLTLHTELETNNLTTYK